MLRAIMRAWRIITKKHGVALYAHYSGVYVSDAVKNNPEWAVVDKNGVVSEDYTSVLFGVENRLGKRAEKGRVATERSGVAVRLRGRTYPFDGRKTAYLRDFTNRISPFCRRTRFRYG